MKSRNIMFICEGSNDEPKFIKRLFDTCYKDSYTTYSYNTNIHILANHIETDYPDFDDGFTDILGILKDYESNPEKSTILNQQYTDIFLIFDFDPQDHVTNFKMIRRILEYYTDSTDQGKLFINYPMMQSYKHFQHLPDDNFKNVVVKVEECKKYKKQIGEISNYTNIETYDYITFISLAVHHLRKANYILQGIYDELTLEDYFNITSNLVYDKQISLLQKTNNVFVLNTCIFILIDFSPQKFFNSISKNKSSFLI